MNGPNANLTPLLTEKYIFAAPADAAKTMGSLATHEAVLLLKPLKVEPVVACLNFMTPIKAAAILRRLPTRHGAQILSRLEVAQAAAVFAAFSVPQKEKIKTVLSASYVKTLQSFSAWPKDCAGRKMSADFFAFRTEVKLSEIVDKLKSLPRKKIPQACIVVDKNGKLKGMIRSVELAFYTADSTAGSVMTDVKNVLAAQLYEDAAELLRQGQVIVPVTDKEGLVLGVIVPEMAPKNAAVKKRFGWF